MVTAEPKTDGAGPVDVLPSPLDAVADMRATARWTIAAAASVGAFALGGTPLAVLGELRNTGDAVAAAAGIVIVLAGVCWSIWRTSEALTPPITTIEALDTAALRPLRDLIAQSPRSFFGPFGNSADDLRREYQRQADIARRLKKELAAEVSPTRRATWEQALRDTQANVDYCARLQRRLLAFVHTWQVREALRRARRHTMAATMVGAAGVFLLLTATTHAT
jgi:hypothetical protein